MRVVDKVDVRMSGGISMLSGCRALIVVDDDDNDDGGEREEKGKNEERKKAVHI